MSCYRFRRPVAAVDMPKPTIYVAAELARLEVLTLFELRAEWRLYDLADVGTHESSR